MTESFKHKENQWIMKLQELQLINQELGDENEQLKNQLENTSRRVCSSGRNVGDIGIGSGGGMMFDYSNRSSGREGGGIRSLPSNYPSAPSSISSREEGGGGGGGVDEMEAISSREEEELAEIEGREEEGEEDALEDEKKQDSSMVVESINNNIIEGKKEGDTSTQSSTGEICDSWKKSLDCSEPIFVETKKI